MTSLKTFSAEEVNSDMSQSYRRRCHDGESKKAISFIF